MKLTAKVCCAVSAVLVLGGCVSAPMQIAGLEFVNRTDMPITGVELRVVGTYEVASCSYISPRGKFSTQFPLREYKGHDVEVVWNDRLGRHRFGPTWLSEPDPKPSQPVMVVINFDPAGHARGGFREK
jgi:hypothetical protein